MNLAYPALLPADEPGAIDLAQRLQRRELSAESVLRASLDRIAEREPDVQAWQHLAAKAALAHARALDRGAVRGRLHGLPVGVKDILDTADMPTAYGSPIYRDHRPAWDAAAVAMARDAGAVILGKTVSTEFATFTPGKTRNPHHVGHTPGGSSSGSAAAVASGMVPLAFGTQTAASIIRPAAFCGIVGFKPTLGRIVRAGIKPLSDTLDTVGGFGRSVDDVALFVAALTGDDRLLDLAFDGSSAPRIGMCRSFQWKQAGPDTQHAMDMAAAILSRAGAAVSDVDLPESLSGLIDAQTTIQEVEQSRNLSFERLHHGEALSQGIRDMCARGMAVPAERYEHSLATALAARAQIDAVFGECDVLFAPSAIGEAPAGLDKTGDPVFCRVWTLLGLPCVHLPFTTGKNGLPVGLQAVGRFGADRATLRAARWMHERLLATMR